MKKQKFNTRIHRSGIDTAGMQRDRVLPTKLIDHEELSEYVEDWIQKGGVIKKLDPGNRDHIEYMKMRRWDYSADEFLRGL